jgi:PAS domain S-box-containing protein
MAQSLETEDLQLLEQLKTGIAIMDSAGMVVRWNAHAARILGIAETAAVGKPWGGLLSVVRGEEISGAEVMASAMKPGGWHGLTQLRLASGDEIWVRAHVQGLKLSPKDRLPGVVALFWPDPGPGAAATADQRPYRDFLRRSPEPLFLTELDFTIVEASERGSEIFGEAADVAGRSLASLLSGWTEGDTKDAGAEILRAGSIVRAVVLQPTSGDTHPAEIVATLISTTQGGLVLVRIHDLTEIRQFGAVLRDLDDLVGLGNADADIEAVADRALEIVAGLWSADLSVVFVASTHTVRHQTGPAVGESVRTRLAGVNPANVPLASYAMAARAPIDIDLDRDTVEPEIAERMRLYGCRTLRATPLPFGDHTVGSLLFGWTGLAPMPQDRQGLELIGRLIGIAVGNAELRGEVLHETELRTSLEGPARLGAVVVNQMTDAIVATDVQQRITVVNPAAEGLYGFTAEEATGRHFGEVIEQTGLDGLPAAVEWLGALNSAGFNHGRIIHRPLIGAFKGRNIVVDLAATVLHDDRRRAAGFVGLAREVTASSHLDSDAAAVAAVAVATGRSRTRQEVANAVLERLCEVTLADFGMIGTRVGAGNQQIEAVRGLGEESLHLIQTVVSPELSDALDGPSPIVALESIGEWLAGTDAPQILARTGLATGFVAALRVRDEPVGFLGLASRRSSWVRPRDEVILQITAQVANALENALLMERLEKGLEQEKRLTAQLEALMGLTLLPRGDTSEEAMAQLLLERVVAALAADGGVVARERAGRLEVVASLNPVEPADNPVESRPVESFGFWNRLVDDPAAGAFYERIADMPESSLDLGPLAGQDVTSHAVFPLREGDRLLGVFLCYFVGQTATTHIDQRNVEAVGRILSIAYANVGMRAGLAEAAEHERRLTAELQALQELTLLGASTDDQARLAKETIGAVVMATGATGGGYILVDYSTGRTEPIAWVGPPSRSWPRSGNSAEMPSDWPPLSQLQSDNGIWLSHANPGQDWETGQCAQAVLPLRVDGRLAGVLHLEWSQPPAIDQYNVRFLEPIARICTISLTNFRLRSELLHRAAAQRALGHRLDTLDELTRVGEEAGSFEELANRTASLVREALGASGVCYLLREPGQHFETHAVAGETGAFRLWLKGVPAKDAPGGNLLLSGGSSVLGDFVAGQVNERVLPLARATGFESFGAIPIRTGTELAGTLLCFFERPAASLPLDDSALDSVARISGIALANYRLRERLVSSEERYRTLFEETPDALLVSALDGTVLDANEAAVRLYRVNRGEVLGRYFGQFITADEREMARRRQIVWAHGGGTFRDRGRRPDGTEFPVQIEIRVVELGGQRRFLHLVRDLSDQESLQRELLQAQKMEAIGQLVSGVAHELNNPLAAIIAFSQLLRSDDRLPEDMKHDAGLLVQEADRTRRIVQNLLDFARARPPERRPTSVAVLVQSVLELQSYALSTNQIQVKVDIPATMPQVDLDRAQLQQVLLNLTINAIQAMRSRDHKPPANLTVSATLVKARASAASRADKADEPPRVRISIRDNGPGVPESVRARLFDPFFTTKQPGEGTGLGLSVSFGIIAAHDGHLWYEPGPGGVGSTFIIELPVTARVNEDRQAADPAKPAEPAGSAAPRRIRQTSKPQPTDPGSGPTTRRPAPRVPAHDATTPVAADDGAGTAAGATAATPNAVAAIPNAAAATPNAAVKPPPGGNAATPGSDRPQILALDDEPSIRAFLRKALAAAGLECRPAQDGHAALEMLRDVPFDAMLIDHRMAGMSGTEFYEAAVEYRPELADRAIFMSGDVLNPDLRGFATQRGIRLLAKPFDIDAVVRIVREVLAAADEAAASAGAANKPGGAPDRLP